jgi:LPS export ABC transporter protein LptC
MVHQEKIRLGMRMNVLKRAIVVSAMAFSFSVGRVILLALPLLLCISCNQSDLKEPLIYDGPQRIGENVELFYTENNQVKVKMIAALVYEFENGDRQFPEGIYLEFYDENGNLESTLRANEAYYFKKENQWRGRGKVEVKNIGKNEQLNTEELFWRPADEKIFTDKFVTIRQQTDVIYGQGLEAKQDMSDYVIKKPEGEFAVEE